MTLPWPSWSPTARPKRPCPRVVDDGTTGACPLRSDSHELLIAGPDCILIRPTRRDAATRPGRVADAAFRAGIAGLSASPPRGCCASSIMWPAGSRPGCLVCANAETRQDAHRPRERNASSFSSGGPGPRGLRLILCDSSGTPTVRVQAGSCGRHVPPDVSRCRSADAGNPWPRRSRRCAARPRPWPASAAPRRLDVRC